MSQPSKRNIPDSRNEGDAPLSRNRQYYLKNRERLIAYQKEKRKNPEDKRRVSEYKKQYHKTNREKILARSKLWYQNNKEERKAFIKEWNKRNPEKIKKYQLDYKMRLRIATFNAYGGAICVCCREDLIQFLTIDHIEGNGNVHRKEIGSRGGHDFYIWLKKNHFPIGYRVLCMNCNHALGIWGYCPHNQLPESTTMPL